MLTNAGPALPVQQHAGRSREEGGEEQVDAAQVAAKQSSGTKQDGGLDQRTPLWFLKCLQKNLVEPWR